MNVRVEYQSSIECDADVYIVNQ